LKRAQEPDEDYPLLGIFRGIDAAASLKRNIRLRAERQFGKIFRGIDAAASLKPAVAGSLTLVLPESSAASMPRPH